MKEATMAVQDFPVASSLPERMSRLETTATNLGQGLDNLARVVQDGFRRTDAAIERLAERDAASARPNWQLLVAVVSATIMIGGGLWALGTRPLQQQLEYEQKIYTMADAHAKELTSMKFAWMSDVVTRMNGRLSSRVWALWNKVFPDAKLPEPNLPLDTVELSDPVGRAGEKL